MRMKLEDFKSCTTIEDEPGLYIVKTADSARKGLVGLFDNKSGEWLVPAQFGDIGKKLSSNLRVVYNERRFGGVYDVKKKKLVAPTVHSQILGCEDDFFVGGIYYGSRRTYLFYTQSCVIIVGSDDLISSVCAELNNGKSKIFRYGGGEGVYENPAVRVVGDLLIAEWVYGGGKFACGSKLLCISLKSGELVTSKDWTQK